MRALNINSFFSKYMLNPLAKELNPSERRSALFFSGFLMLFLGIPHLITYCWNLKKVSKINLQKEINANFFSVKKIDELFSKIISEKSKTIGKHSEPLTRKKVQKVVQDFVEKFYSRKLPPKEDVEVCFQEKMVKWLSLKSDQKIEVNNLFAHPHDKVSKGFLSKLFIDYKIFTTEGQASFLPNDPRKHHGSDHSVRAAIFAGVFGYLYKKYHPDLDPSLQDIYLAQIVAAGHDSGRQAEGTDFWDEQSADNTVELLKEMGIIDQVKLDECRAAIADKDNKELNSKNFIAKCVQNADCVEYARIKLKKSSQDKHVFNDSREYLDIFKEMQKIADNDQNKVLKNDLTYTDFLKELDSIRKEMNVLIFKTHKKKFREKISVEKNYYAQILGRINSVEFPLLDHILVETEIKKNNFLKSENKKAYDTAKNWIDLGQLEQISIDQIKLIAGKLNRNSNKSEKIGQKLANELINRKIDGKKSPIYNDNDLELQKLITNSMKLEEGEEFAELISKHAADLLLKFKDSSEDKRDHKLPILAALGYKKAADIYLKLGNDPKALLMLDLAASEIILNSTTPFAQIIVEKKIIPSPVYFLRGSSSFTRRKVRLSNLKIDGEEWVEVSVELTAKARFELDKYLKLLKENSNATFSTVPANFPGKNFKTDEYESKTFFTVGTDTKIIFKNPTDDVTAEVFVGNQQEFYNEFKHLRIRIKPGTTLTKLHKIFCSLGMPEALCESREEDIRQELLARVLTFRFPELVFEPVSRGEAKLEPTELYETLSEENKLIVEKDVENMVLKQVGPGNFEYVNPTLKDEAQKLGARAIGTFVQAGAIKSTANVVAKILKDSMLSSQERFKRGILGLGCVPLVNYNCGSANQVFTRIYTENIFKENTGLDEFAITGPVQLLFDLEAFERLPYTYLEDRGGLRNPKYYRYVFTAENQKPIFNFKGHTQLLDRKGFNDGIKSLAEEKCLLNETMFENSLSGSYIKKIVVWSEDDKLILMRELAREGIESVNGMPLRKAVVVSQTLNESIIENF